MDDLNAISAMMRDFIEMAVRLEIAEISSSGMEITEWHIEEAQRRLALPRTHGCGEELIFAIQKRGETQRSMRDLIEALAIMACVAPGGIDFANLHFEANYSSPMDCVKTKEKNVEHRFKRTGTAD